MGYKIGVDVGGTFTDFLVADDRGDVAVYKTPTTPQNPGEGVFQGLAKIAISSGLDLNNFLQKVDLIVHGTTISANAVLTGTGAKTGFLTTKGFRDVLNMRRGLREKQFESKINPPPALVSRYLTQVVEERIDCEGKEITPLKEEDLYGAANFFRNQGVEAIGVSFLFSFLNPSHEKRAEQVLSQELPHVYLSLSSEVLPQVRLYERNSTTALNAYVGPILARYLEGLTDELKGKGFRGMLLIMQSNGGVIAPEVAKKFAVSTLLSGPAAAPTAGTFYVGAHGIRDFITIDMGGTSFDCCLIKGQQPAITTEGKVGNYNTSLPMIDIHTIGAGGGSIAWIDAAGFLQVGPKSAGASPGPVCYGKGGIEPTVTDADLMLGYLDPKYFLGGEIKLDKELTMEVIKEKIADRLKLDAIRAAYGIYKVVNANMAAALRVISVEKGYDPREFALVVAGGAGPAHAGMIAEELEIPLILIPKDASVFCASGMLVTDLKHDYVRTYAVDVEKLTQDKLNAIYYEMKEQALRTLKDEGITEDKITLFYSLDLRYIGQFHEVNTPFEYNDEMEDGVIGKAVEAFHKRHDVLYGYSLPGAPTEVINVRLSAKGETSKIFLKKFPFMGENAAHAIKGYREAFFGNGFIKTPIYDGLKMEYGNRVKGPAIIDHPETTAVIPPHWFILCDEFNNYIMYPEGKEGNVKAIFSTFTS